MDERRENLADDHYKKERNETLMMSLLECYFQMMDGLKKHESRESLGITDQTYYRLLGVFFGHPQQRRWHQQIHRGNSRITHSIRLLYGNG